jgi:glycosyltransferase involved in cell wall biosynthesis
MRAMEKQKRVCIVRHSFYPFELNVKREAEALVKEGYAVSIICLRQDDERAHERVGGVDVHRLPVGHQRGNILRYAFEYNAFFLLASLKLLQLWLKGRFDAIQVNTMPDALVFTTLIPKLFGAKVVLHMHEPMPELFGTMFKKWYRWYFIWIIKVAEKFSLMFADRVLTVTREMRDNFGRRGADVNKITVIVNVPDENLFRPQLYEHLREKIARIKKEERRQGIFRIFTHGAIERRYGVDVMVRAVHHLVHKIPGIRFHFLGKGDYLDDVLRLAKELKVEGQVEFLGFVPFESMVEEILLADIGIVPVKKNPYSNLVHTNKMYEYIALDRPVIASRLDSVTSYFSEDSILYFESGNAEDLADKIFHLFAHPEEIEARMSRIREVYDTYRWDREQQKYLGVYRSLLGQ